METCIVPGSMTGSSISRSVLVTGASGYVGSHVASALVQRGCAVTGLVRSDEGAAKITRLGITPLLGNLGNAESLLVAAAAADIVIHLGFEYDQAGNEIAATDLVATRALISGCRMGEGRLFVYTGSLFRYRPPNGFILDEEHWQPREMHDWRCALEAEVLAVRSLRTAVIRLGWVHGGDGGTLENAIAPFVNGGVPATIANHRLPVIRIEDVCELYWHVASRHLAGLFHACRGEPLTLSQIVAAARERIAGPTVDFDAPRDHFASIFATDLPARSLRDVPYPLRGSSGRKAS